MTRKTPIRTEDRRRFLKELAVAGGTTALIAMTGRAAAAAPDDEPAAGEPEQKGYHVTPHVQTYYRKARL